MQKNTIFYKKIWSVQKKAVTLSPNTRNVQYQLYKLSTDN